MYLLFATRQEDGMDFTLKTRFLHLSKPLFCSSKERSKIDYSIVHYYCIRMKVPLRWLYRRVPKKDAWQDNQQDRTRTGNFNRSRRAVRASLTSRWLGIPKFPKKSNNNMRRCLTNLLCCIQRVPTPNLVCCYNNCDAWIGAKCYGNGDRPFAIARLSRSRFSYRIH